MHADVTMQQPAVINCVLGGAVVKSDAPTKCQPGHRCLAHIKHGDTNAADDLKEGSKKCMAAKEQAKKFVAKDIKYADCKPFIVLEGACKADKFPGLKECPI